MFRFTRIVYTFLVLFWANTAVAAEMPKFPYPLVESTGLTAIQDWERLKETSDGTPIIIGSKDALLYTLIAFDPSYADPRSPQQIIDAANQLTHPRSHQEWQAGEFLELVGLQKTPSALAINTMIKEMIAENQTRDIRGRWPLFPQENEGGLSLTQLDGRPYDKVYIAIIPTDDPTTLPAYLKFGGWNANPPSEYHIAALRSWKERYGAEPVIMNVDVIELRVARRPDHRRTALALAEEQMFYTEDIVLQGYGSTSALAALLMRSDWWYFWWD